MIETQNLSITLNSKVDALLARFEIIKSENEMLRDELSRTKDELASKNLLLKEQENSTGLQEQEAQMLIVKLERALAV